MLNLGMSVAIPHAMSLQPFIRITWGGNKKIPSWIYEVYAVFELVVEKQIIFLLYHPRLYLEVVEQKVSWSCRFDSTLLCNGNKYLSLPIKSNLHKFFTSHKRERYIAVQSHHDHFWSLKKMMQTRILNTIQTFTSFVIKYNMVFQYHICIMQNKLADTPTKLNNFRTKKLKNLFVKYRSQVSWFVLRRYVKIM